MSQRQTFSVDITGNATITGNALVAGTARIAGPATVTGNFSIGGTGRLVSSATEGAFYLGTGTRAYAFCQTTVRPGDGYRGVGTGYDIGSLLSGGTAPHLYVKTGYAETNWASIDVYD